MTGISRLESGIPEVQSADRTLSTRGVAWVVFLVALIALTATSWDDVSQPRYEHGDFAANSILIDKALSLELIHGNYSRTGFYHPGPALLYVQAGSQLLLHDLVGIVPTPYNAHLLGIFALNAAMLALAGRVLYRVTESVSAVASLLVAAFAYSLLFGGVLSTTWMPHVYIWPFLLLLVSSASAALGHTRDLWVFVLACGFLVHGHISFALPVVVFTAAAALAWGLRHRRRWLSVIPAIDRIAALGTLAVFLIPLVLQLIIEFPGQFDDYVRYVRETELPPRGIGEVGRYLAQYWGFQGLTRLLVPTLVIATFASTFLEGSAEGRESRLALFSAGVLASITTAIYAFTGIDDFNHAYLALFYISAPILYWTLLSSAVFDRWVRGKRVLTATTAAGAGVALMLILIQPKSGTFYEGSDVGIAYHAMDQKLDPDIPVALSLSTHSDWGVAIGILEQARRDQRPTCVRVGPGILELVFTSENVCEPEQGDRVEALITTAADPPNPNAALLFDGANYDIWRTDG